MDLRLKTAGQLSPEEQRFLDEETTNRQVVQSQASAAAMVEAEKAKAAEWAEVREQWRVDAEKARQEEKQGAEAKAAALAEERYRVSVQWATAGRDKAILWLDAARAQGRPQTPPQRRGRMSSVMSSTWTAGNPRSSSTKAGCQCTG